MSTTPSPAATKPTTKPTTPKGERRSWTLTLRDGADGRLEIWCERRKLDIAVFVRHKSGPKAKATRGASTTHTDVAAAQATMATLAASAEKAGWVRSSRGGYSPRPDAFTIDTLPRPGKVAAKVVPAAAPARKK